jgi:hypothetical protein
VTPDELDMIVEQPVRNLVRAINEVPNMETLQSCGGHIERGTEGQYWVEFVTYSWVALEMIASILGYDSTKLAIDVCGWDADEEENHDPSDWLCGFRLMGGPEITADEVAERIRKRHRFLTEIGWEI